MAELIELTPDSHADLKVVANCAVKVASTQHMINLRVTELGQAGCSFPTFITKAQATGGWACSAITALETGKNLFVEDNIWLASYQPASMQTFPLHLMQSPKDEKKYTIGIDETSDAFSREEGEPLFDENNKASIYLSQVSAQLEANIKSDIQTHEFVQKMDDLGLIKSIDVMVEYANGSVNTLKGLHTLDEDKMKSMPIEQFDELREKGYLAPMYGMLISIFQLNTLLRKHNEVEGSSKVKQIKMEVSKDYANLQ